MVDTAAFWVLASFFLFRLCHVSKGKVAYVLILSPIAILIIINNRLHVNVSQIPLTNNFCPKLRREFPLFHYKESDFAVIKS